ncbi:MAG: glycosyltransferase family 4 protein [Nitrospira sp.]|nr:glycosyltransferase family 4 protein [Nitrospira sp.]
METVCHVITKLELGGAQEIALHLASHLDPAKYRPVLATGPGGLLNDDAKSIRALEVILLSWLGRPVHLFGDVAALIELIVLFRRLRPTIVHTHSSKAGILGRWAAWFAGVPIIVHTIHGFGITPGQSPPVRLLFTWLERITGWITTHWIAVARADIDRGKGWGLFERNVSLIRPGIDPRPFQLPTDPRDREVMRGEFGAGPDHWLVGTVACLKPQKAPEHFMAVAKNVCERLPQARFLLIGDGELRQLVESLIGRYGLEDRVRLAGWRRDVPASMKAMDAFVLTSRWEGLPRVVLEARATGLPIVATNVGGVQEAMATHRSSVVVDDGDVEAMSVSLVRLYRQSRESLDNVKQREDSLPLEFHIDYMVHQYETLYGELLEGRRDELRSQALGLLR